MIEQSVVASKREKIGRYHSGKAGRQIHLVRIWPYSLPKGQSDIDLVKRARKGRVLLTEDLKIDFHDLKLFSKIRGAFIDCEPQDSIISLSICLLASAFSSSRYIVTSMPGPRVHPITKKRVVHRGIDIAPTGTKLFQVEVEANQVSYSSETGFFVDFKIFLKGYVTCLRVMHLNYDSLRSVVWVGSTGRSTGPHLHIEPIYVFELENMNEGDYVFDGYDILSTLGGMYIEAD